MAIRQAFYKYIVVMVFLSTSLEFSRFFEFKLNSEGTEYWTTTLAEDPYYVQFNSYWNEILATGLVPLVMLCYMNFKIFRKIKASNSYGLRFVAKTNSGVSGDTSPENRKSFKSSMVSLVFT